MSKRQPQAANGGDMNNKILRKLAGPVLGAGGGYLVFKWITCRGGG